MSYNAWDNNTLKFIRLCLHRSLICPSRLIFFTSTPKLLRMAEYEAEFADLDEGPDYYCEGPGDEYAGSSCVIEEQVEEHQVDE
jgi:hypothetical protein